MNPESLPETKPRTLIDPKAYLVPILVLGGLMVAAGLSVHFVEPGEFVSIPNEATGSEARAWAPVHGSPLPWWKIPLAPLLCLGGPRGPQIAGLIVCIVLIGASFSLMNGSGAIPGLIEKLATRFQKRRTLFLVSSTGAFAVLGSALGMMEEVTPMILFFVPLAMRMGWDRLTGMAIPFAGAGCGFAAATLNPFTLGVAQREAGIPLFSGFGLRAFLFVTVTMMVTAFIWRHARKIEQGSMGRIADLGGSMPDTSAEQSAALPRPRLTAMTMATCLGFLVALVISLRWLPDWMESAAFPLIALAFVITGLVVGRLQACPWHACWRHFRHGIIAFAPALVLVLMAASVPFLLEEGNTKDTIVYRLATGIEGAGLSPSGVAVLMFLFQSLLNLLVPGGTSQAMLTVPVLANLGEQTGVSAQTVVLAFHCGDGFSNLIWPTNPLLMVALGLAGVRYRDWFRFILPLQIGLLLLSVLFLVLAVWVGYGMEIEQVVAGPGGEATPP